MDRRETDQTFYILLHLDFFGSLYAKTCSFQIEYDICYRHKKKPKLFIHYFICHYQQQKN